MASSPVFKVYSVQRDYRASFKFAEDAVMFCAFLGDGATVRHGHRLVDVVWTEGKEEFSASDSYDRAAAVVRERCVRYWA